MEQKFKIALCIKGDLIMEFIEGKEYNYEEDSNIFYNEYNEPWKLSYSTIENNFVLY